ncbi:amino acid adenylation domain-containing protein [Ningiella sp. W23]|uniref:amino acid adenylation domain-containing protein n=1 Tax=Ningiella sp. W23 TaxID=3023715 RepID=UPI003757CC57
MVNICQVITTLNSNGISIFAEDGKLKTRAGKDCVTKELAQLIRQNKDELLDFLSASSGEKTAHQLVHIASNEAPLSYAQQRLWILDQMESGSQYNMPFALRLSGQLNAQALQCALNTIVSRHAILRTCYRIDKNGEAYQQLRDVCDVELQWHDCNPQSLSKAIEDEAQRPFDLGHDLMLRAKVLCTAPDEYVLLLTMHHIASDGWSMGIFLQELSASYNAMLVNQRASLPELPVQYADYARWQRTWLQGEVLEQQLSYWTEHLADLPVVHNLPLDKPRTTQASFNGGQHVQSLPYNTQEKLRTLCQAQNASLFMGVQALFAAFLSRYSGESDIVMGTPTANREQSEIAGLIGFFVNTLVLRNQIDAEQQLSDIISASRQMLLDAYAHQQVPFEKVVEALQPERTTQHSPLFQIMLSWSHHGEDAALDLDGLSVEPIGSQTSSAKYELSLTAGESEEGLVLAWEYNSDVFNGETIARMATHFNQFASALIHHSELSVGRAPMLSKDEQAQFERWNATQSPVPSLCLHEQFESQALAHPTAIAVTCEHFQLSYCDLNAQANQLARYLQAQRQVSTETLVGICLPRSPQLLVAILAVLKAGGAYVPLDPTYPQERLKQIQEDAQLATVITSESIATDGWLARHQRLAIDEPSIQIGICDLPIDNLARPCNQEQLAYVIYTSGSTGKPKGVMVEHGNVMALCDWHINEFNLSALSVGTQTANTAFDASVWEIWPYLLSGGSLVQISDERLFNIDSLPRFLNSHSVTHCFLVTPIAVQFMQSEELAESTLQYLLVGGDALSAKDIPQLPFTLVNNYGPTECTVVATSTKVVSVTDNVSIGRPIRNTSVYVLDQQMQLAPIGVTGELYVGGAGVARAYLNREDLTEQRFIDNPFYDPAQTGSSRKLYRTGDLVRWQADGQLYYLGRNDFQVKLRGFRIELGDIENALLKQEGVKEALVLAQESPAGKHLVAYYRAKERLNSDVLRQRLSQQLPDYMLPQYLVNVAQFPLTANGKIDRSALPAPQLQETQAYEAPQGQTEQALADIWKELLGIERVSRHDNFFMLGGHSLLVTRLTVHLQKHLNVNLNAKSIFERPKLCELARHIDTSTQQTSYPAITPSKDLVKAPLSYAQQRLWILDQMESGSQYNMPFALRLSGQLNAQALQCALNTIVSRHAILRTCYRIDKNGEAYQQLRDVCDVELQWHDCNPQSLSKAIEDEAQRPFDLGHDLMLRAKVLCTAPDEYVLLLTMHHIASDGWSMGIFLQELSASYNAMLVNQRASLPELPVQYADYARWQRTWLQGEVLEQQLSYWTEHLADLPVVHNLPLDKPRTTQASFNGGQHVQSLPYNTQEKLRTLCQAQNASLFMGVQALFAAFLSRYSGESDIVMGTPTANREQSEIAGLIGFFVNTLVLRNQIDAEQQLSDIISASRQMLLDAYAHQQVPFEKVVEALQPERTTQHSPLFQIMLSWSHHGEDAALDLDGLSVEPIGSQTSSAKYELSLTAGESEEGLVLAWEYNSDVFNGETIARMATHFNQFASALIHHSELSVGRAPMLSKDEQAQFERWNATQSPVPSLCLHEQFESQALAHPTAIAVTCEHFQLSYCDLNAQANQLARYLQAQRQVSTETLVGICLPRSPQLLVAILAVLKAGGAYVPLDPTYPQERLKQIQEDAQLATVITSESIATDGWLARHQRLAIDEPSIQIGICDLPIDNLARPCNQEQLAYVIYTSGSTGKPKGVMVEHGNVVNYTQHMADYCQLSKDDRILQFTTPNFDVFVEEYTSALCNGASLVLRDTTCAQGSFDFRAFGAKHKLTMVSLPTAFFHELQSQGNKWVWPQLRVVIVGGEALNFHQGKDFCDQCPNVNLINAYGPSETTISATMFRVNENVGNAMPIGLPIANNSVYVLDEHMHLAPIGVTGELYVGGAGVARAYLNREDLTEQRFIDNPFYDPAQTGSSRKLYRTGDLVRWQADGQLYYLGRNDFQVKLRGFRIELGDIENALLKQEGVKEALVLAQESPAGKHLVAYYRAKERLNSDVLRQRLSQQLPDYMLPQYLVNVAQFPLTANGKIDRSALPAPQLQEIQAYEAPQGQTEQALADIWKELLGIERVSRHDNFFTLGGHSLLMIRLRAEIENKWYCTVSAQQLLSKPALRSQAELIASQKSQDLTVCHLLKSGKSSRKAFIIHPIGGDTLCYHRFVSNWTSEINLYGVCHPGLVERAVDYENMDLSQLANYYVDEILKIQSKGPYYLMGWSLGGVLCLEIARRLYIRGAKVDYLGLMDSHWHVRTNQSFDAAIEIPNFCSSVFSKEDWQRFDQEHQIESLCLATGLSTEQQRAIVWSGIRCLEQYSLTTDFYINHIQYFSAVEPIEIQETKTPCLKQLQLITNQREIVKLHSTHYGIVEAPFASLITDKMIKAIHTSNPQLSRKYENAIHENSLLKEQKND